MPNLSMGVRDVAKKIGLSEWGVRLYLKQGLLPGYRLNGVWRFDPDEIDAWLAARHQPGRVTRLPEVNVPT